ncbi:class I SAM-dependent methyltransferase [Mycolicibacter icosiumassiliensis]|uniref:class I SAM-dependent methyltransferase n=1 Tax=Mycolicibacter icosiumassiliensis TaxID=1792835 RepID=UPI00082EB0D5|nr:methyltransferase domain-containing protein [Mycolicibacter icosiumassiliensis]
MTRYDVIGQRYSRARRPDPRIFTAINDAVDEMGSIANIGAGAGSYEPAQTVVAVEPSHLMISQRPARAAPAVRAVAEHLPLRSHSVDAALAILTIHHWSDLGRGISELVRIARRRVVIFTWDHSAFQNFWLLRDYLPAAGETDARLAVSLDRLQSLLPAEASIRPVPVPHDCTDGFGGAYWRRPDAYLDPVVQAGMSMLALTSKSALRPGLTKLRHDLKSGAWATRHEDLLGESDLDLGYRLVVTDLP